jgi:hypothetical protein
MTLLFLRIAREKVYTVSSGDFHRKSICRFFYIFKINHQDYQGKEHVF